MLSIPIGYQNLNLTFTKLCREGRLKDAIHRLFDITTHNPPPLYSSACLQLLQACIANNALTEGKLIHSLIAQIGSTFDPSTHSYLQNKLIHMYVNCESLADARKVFDRMTERDVFSWNMIVSAYQRHGLPRQALTLFGQMQMQQTGAAVQPNQFTYPTIIQACAKLGDLDYGLLIHQRLNKSGILSDLIVASALIDMYAKCGKIHEACKLFDKMPQQSAVSCNAMIVGYAKSGLAEKARELFDKMPHRDVVSWNAMIAGYAENGLDEKALEIFKQMLLAGVKPSSATFASMLPACAKMGALEEGMLIHQRIVENGLSSDVVVAGALIDMYAKCGSIQKASELFDKIPHLDTVSWNLMIAGYAQNGLVEKASETFNQMRSAYVKPSPATFASILPACANMGALKEGMDLHQRIIEGGFSSDVVVASSLIDMYAKCGRMDKARKVFDKMPRRDEVAWTTIIAGYTSIGLLENAQELFDKMPRQSVVSWNVMIAGYAQSGLVNKARELFDKMSQRDVVSWNAVIAGYEQNGFFEEALDIFMQMQLAGVKPSAATFASILPVCAKMGTLEQGLDIHQRIIENGFSSHVVVASALIDMYAKCGSIQKACELFDKMDNANLVSWTAMIAAYAMHGFTKDALKLFELMKHSGINPNHVSFTCVLFACSHAGLVDEGCKYFNSMSESHHIMPTMDHYVCVIDLLGRAGYLREALNFIVKMPIKPDVIVWMCLLGACRSHKIIGIGKFTASLLFMWDPKDAASYVLLSNIYAEVGRWNDVQKVRKLMKDRGVKKTAGCSWIEVNKMVHVFCVDGGSHP